MINKIYFWLQNSRLFSLPMAILSWMVIFTYSLKFNGNVLNGILALIGIACGQLATNLFDDYVDYKKLTSNSQQCKCAYIKEGKATLKEVLLVVITYCAVAFVIGVVLFLRTGFPVIWLAIVGGIVVLSYSKFSQIGLSELAVGITFGPLLFEGVYYVMTQSFSWEVLILSLAVVMFTIGLMYVHTILDFEGDLSSHKRTLVCRLGSKNLAINGIWVVYGLGYLFTFIFGFVAKNYLIFSTIVLLPLIFKMYNSLKTFTCGGEVKEFYSRLLKARNLMVYYSLMAIICLLHTN
ncbi:prenyltransferase [bacterium]|nr:prenyltransferase [bacterium]